MSVRRKIVRQFVMNAMGIVQSICRNPAPVLHAQLGARQGGDGNTGCASVQQCLSAGSRRGAGGHNVVNQQDVAALDLPRLSHAKSASKVDASLVGRQQSLWRGLAMSDKRSGRELERPTRVRSAQRLESRCSKQARLVEPPLALAARMQRYRNDEHRRRSFGGHRSDRRRQHLAQRSAHGQDAAVLESVDGQAQLVAVGGEGNNAREGRQCEAANSTNRIR